MNRTILMLIASAALLAACSPKTYDLRKATYDKDTFESQYKLNKDDWDAAFAFMARKDLDTLRAGRYELTPTCYAKIQELTTREGGKWERHEKVVDVFCVVRGEDKVGVSELGDLKEVVRAYDPKRDVETFARSDSPRYVVLKKGESIFLFPTDGHLPNQAVDGPASLKVAVVKVPFFKPSAEVLKKAIR